MRLGSTNSQPGRATHEVACDDGGAGSHALDLHGTEDPQLAGPVWDSRACLHCCLAARGRAHEQNDHITPAKGWGVSRQTQLAHEAVHLPEKS